MRAWCVCVCVSRGPYSCVCVCACVRACKCVSKQQTCSEASTAHPVVSWTGWVRTFHHHGSETVYECGACRLHGSRWMRRGRARCVRRARSVHQPRAAFWPRTHRGPNPIRAHKHTHTHTRKRIIRIQARALTNLLIGQQSLCLHRAHKSPSSYYRDMC
jgi:hypothetical protein